MPDPTIMQAAVDLSATAHDVVVGPVAFDFPWGDNLADEGVVGVLAYLANRAIDAWREVESDRAVFGGSE